MCDFKNSIALRVPKLNVSGFLKGTSIFHGRPEDLVYQEQYCKGSPLDRMVGVCGCLLGMTAHGVSMPFSEDVFFFIQ